MFLLRCFFFVMKYKKKSKKEEVDYSIFFCLQCSRKIAQININNNNTMCNKSAVGVKIYIKKHTAEKHNDIINAHKWKLSFRMQMQFYFSTIIKRTSNLFYLFCFIFGVNVGAFIVFHFNLLTFKM